MSMSVITAYIVCSVIAFCYAGNILVLVVIAVHKRMRTITNFFLANLAAADLCVGVFCVLPNLATYLSPYWLFGRVRVQDTHAYTAVV